MPDDSDLEGVRIEVLSKLMNTPIHVPSLAQATPTILANLYIFANGRIGLGTRGFQPDVLDHLPRSTVTARCVPSGW